jgi:hypothetical protein
MGGCCCENCYSQKTLHDGAEAIGDGAELSVIGRGTIQLQVSGTFVAELEPQVTLDRVEWIPLPMRNVETGAVVTVITGPGLYVAAAVGDLFKAPITDYTSGAVDAVAISTCEGTGSAIGDGITDVAITSGPTGASALEVQGTAADNAAAVGDPVQMGGVAVDSATYAPGYTAGDAAKLAIDQTSGALLVDPGLPATTRVRNAAGLAASLVIKNSPGLLTSVVGYNDGPQQWIMIFDAIALPANGATPEYLFRVEADSNFSLDIPPGGSYFSTGITIGNSTTQPTLTTGAADCWFTAERI